MYAAQVVITPSSFLTEKIAGYFPVVQPKLRTVPLGVKTLALRLADGN